MSAGDERNGFIGAAVFSTTNKQLEKRITARDRRGARERRRGRTEALRTIEMRGAPEWLKSSKCYADMSARATRIEAVNFRLRQRLTGLKK